MLDKAYFNDWYPYKEGQLTYLIDNHVTLYGFLIFLGMICSILTIFYFWWRQKYTIDYYLILIIITIPSSIVGARLAFIFERLQDGDYSISKNWYAIWQGGLSIQGGVILPTILNLLYIYTKRKYIDYRVAFSLILPAVLIGQAIGRWGNFSNHEVFGKVDTDGRYTLWLGESIARNMYIIGSADNQAQLRVPLFFYEFLTSIFGYAILVWILNFFGWLKPGVTGALYLVYYGIVRVSMENFREEHYNYYIVIAILYIVVGALLAIYYQFFTWLRFKFVWCSEPKRFYFIKQKEYKNKFMKKLAVARLSFGKFKITASKEQRYSLRKEQIGKLNIWFWDRTYGNELIVPNPVI